MILRMPGRTIVQTAMPDARAVQTIIFGRTAVQITSISGRTSRANHIHFRTHGRANHIHFRTHEPCVPTEKYSLTAKERNLIDTHM